MNAFQHPLSSRRRRLLQYAPPPTAPTPGPLRIQVPQHGRGAASPIPTRPAPTHPELNWLRASTVSAVGDAAPRHHLRPMTHPLEVPARRPALGPSQATTRRRLGLRSSPPCVPVRKTTGPRLRHPWRHHQYRPTRHHPRPRSPRRGPRRPPLLAPSRPPAKPVGVAAATPVAFTQSTATAAARPQEPSQRPPLPHPDPGTAPTRSHPAAHREGACETPPVRRCRATPSDDHHPASSATPETSTDRRCRAAAPPAANKRSQQQPPTPPKQPHTTPTTHSRAARQRRPPQTTTQRQPTAAVDIAPEGPR